MIKHSKKDVSLSSNNSGDDFRAYVESESTVYLITEDIFDKGINCDTK